MDLHFCQTREAFSLQVPHHTENLSSDEGSDGGVAKVHSRCANVQREENSLYNGEKLLDDEKWLIYDEKERKSWEVIIILPGVEVISEYTFAWCVELEAVIMADDSVRRIEVCAIEKCKSLMFVKLSRNLEYIGDGAFFCCESLPSIFIPPSCREIGNYVFSHCKKLIILSVSQNTELGENKIKIWKSIAGQISI